jgi:hypothetical protein
MGNPRDGREFEVKQARKEALWRAAGRRMCYVEFMQIVIQKLLMI